MFIDEFKEDDYYLYKDIAYETPVDLYQMGVFDFCGCGSLEENLRYIRDGLQHISDLKEKVWPDDISYTYQDWEKDEERIFGSEMSAQFFYYWCDSKELTEHGGMIPGWLSPEGEEVLRDLSEICKENGYL